MAYTIKSGDTLSALAKANNTDIATLQKLNPNITDINKIYAGQTLNLPTATPAPTTPVAPSLAPPVAPTTPDTGAIASPITLNDLQARLAANLATIAPAQKAAQEAQTSLTSQLDQFRKDYLDALQLSPDQTQARTDLAAKQLEEKNFNLSVQQGQQAQYGLGRPLALSTGRAGEIARQAEFTKQSLAAEESNILARLGLANEAQQAKQQGLQAGISFLQQDINTQLAVQQRLQTQEQNLISNFNSYSTQQKKDVADILSTLSGVNPSKLSPEAQAQIAKISAAIGVAPSDIIRALQHEYDKNTLDIALKNAQIANENADTKKKLNPTNTFGEPTAADKSVVFTWLGANPKEAKTIDKARLATDPQYFYWVKAQIEK